MIQIIFQITLELYKIALNCNSLKDALIQTKNNKCIGMLDEYNKALTIYQESTNNENISDEFKIKLNRQIDVNKLLDFIDQNTNKFINFTKLKSQINYLNKMIERGRFRY